MFNNLKEDYKRYGAGKKPTFLRFCFRAVRNAGFRAVMLYRIGFWLRKRRCRLLAAITERIMHHLCYCWIGTKVEIGPGLKIAHTIGLIIGNGTVIGKNCDVRQNTTFGGNYSKVSPDGRRYPLLGDNVSVGAGAVILGPVKVGSNSVIGANAVVAKDVPENVIVGGVPAKVIKQRWNEGSGRGI